MDATAKYYKVYLTGKVNNCLSCSLEKIRQKNIPRKNEDKSKNPGERMYLDISSKRKPRMGGRQHWVMLVDEATKYKKKFFLKKKNEQVEPIIDWIKALKTRHKIQVNIIRCDNAGENKVVERESDKKELGIIFEYTAPGTLQQNGVVKRAFVTAMGRARAMMNHAGFTMAKRQQLWVRQQRLPHCWIIFWFKTVPKVPLLLNFLELMQSMPSIQEFLEKCVLLQIHIIKWGGPRLIQKARSVYLMGTTPNTQEMSTDS